MNNLELTEFLSGQLDYNNKQMENMTMISYCFSITDDDVVKFTLINFIESQIKVMEKSNASIHRELKKVTEEMEELKKDH